MNKFKLEPKLVDCWDIYNGTVPNKERIWLIPNSSYNTWRIDQSDVIKAMGMLPSKTMIQVWELEDEPEPEKVCDKTIEIDGVKYKLVPEDQ